MKTTSMHIVRRFGPVGGMENYVYQLTQALSRKGHRVTVLCENNESLNLSASIRVIPLSNRIKKPRWLAQLRFSQRVSEYLDSHPPVSNTIIHSHERTAKHHITTFHGPPFLNRKIRALDFLSPRISAWTVLEKRELTSPQVQAILPNSNLISEQLKTLYPSIADKILAPAYPGVSETFTSIKRQSNGKTIGFIGKEWQRKGLDFACQVFKALRKKIPDVHFIVAGCEPNDIAGLLRDLPKASYTLMGWSTPETFLEKIDLLLHPARAEPFGMVIAEANAARIPVVVSNQCGIASMLTHKQGKVCAINDEHFDDKPWVTSCIDLLKNPINVSPLNLTWDKLANQHIEIYRAIDASLRPK